MTEPELRASVVIDVHTAIATSFPAWESLIDPVVRRRLAVLAPTSWVPAPWLFALEDTLFARFGDDALRSVRRRAVTLTMDGMLRAIKDAAVPADDCPACLLRWAPGARAQGMRGLGHATYARTTTGAHLRVEGAPAHVAASPSWRAGSAGALLGVLDVAGATGTVGVHDDGADVVFDVRWP